MKLYEFSLAPSPRRVRMFIAEKGIEIPDVQINTRERQQFSDAYRAVNPNCVVPTLVLDDGTCIGETVAICRYLEETHPEPPLMGRNAKEKAVVEMWSRQAEYEGYLAAAEAVRNAAPMFEDRGLPGVPGGVPQIPALIERGKQTMGRLFPSSTAGLPATAISPATPSPSPTSRHTSRSTSRSAPRSRFPQIAPTSPAGSPK